MSDTSGETAAAPDSGSGAASLTTPASVPAPARPAPSGGGTVTLRTPFPVGRLIATDVDGAPVITAEGTEVPSALVQPIKDAAAAAGVDLEEV